MSSTNVNKMEMSLDDIIKAGKKGKAGGLSPSKRSGAVRRTAGKKPIKAKGGVTKRRVTMQLRNRAQKRAGTSKPIRGRGIVAKRNNNKATTVATKKLVQKLVKKALAQSKVRPGHKGLLVRNVRRRPINIKRVPITLNRVSQRSRLISRINRRPRISAVPIAAPVVGRGRGRFVYASTPTTFVQTPVGRRRIVAVQQPRPIIVQQQRPVYQQPRVIYRMAQSAASMNSVRGQVKAMRQQQQQVVYVHQPFQPHVIVRQQPQRQQFVKSRRPRQNQQGGYYLQSAQKYGRNNRQQRRVVKQEPFVDPPNFLQRVPPQQVVVSRRFARN